MDDIQFGGDGLKLDFTLFDHEGVAAEERIFIFWRIAPGEIDDAAIDCRLIQLVLAGAEDLEQLTECPSDTFLAADDLIIENQDGAVGVIRRDGGYVLGLPGLDVVLPDFLGARGGGPGRSTEGQHGEDTEKSGFEGRGHRVSP